MLDITRHICTKHVTYSYTFDLKCLFSIFDCLLFALICHKDTCYLRQIMNQVILLVLVHTHDMLLQV